MKKLDELLPADVFFRSHKSFIVRFEAIKAVNGNQLEMSNNAKVPIGPQYRESLLRILKSVN
jgi:two-component system, LytTR family, response regulator